MVAYVTLGDCKEKIEASERLLNMIYFYIVEGAEHLKANGGNALAKEAQEIAQEIYNTLDALDYYNKYSG